MKKTLVKLIAVLLSVLLLSGCAMPEVLQPAAEKVTQFTEKLFNRSSKDDTEDEQARLDAAVRFSEMDYSRPDLNIMQQHADDVLQAIEGAAKLNEVEDLLDILYDDYYNYDTMYSIAMIRYYLDMTDGYYEEEYEWCDESNATVDRIFDDVYYACAGSSLGKKLEDDYFWEGFCDDYDDPEESNYSDAVVALLEQESALLSKYYELSASETIEIDGEEVDIDEYLDSCMDYDSYIEGLRMYSEKYNSLLGPVFIELVRVRKQIAEERGYDSYEEMQYDMGFSRDYTPEDADAYMSDIRSFIVPIYKKYYHGKNSTPTMSRCTQERLMNTMDSFIGSLGGEAQKAYDFMKEYELYDVAHSDNKVGMSFELYLTNYESPFLFVNADEDNSDMLTMIHEFGHYLDDYVNYSTPHNIDIAECFSQGLEFISLTYLQEIMISKEYRAISKYKMLDALDTYIQQSSFAEFEHRAYQLDDDELTIENLNKICLQLTKDYGYCDTGYDFYYETIWTEIPHFFESPFYVISYIVSNDVAMQFYELERNDPGSAYDVYLEMIVTDYDGIIETAESVGLESPFAPGRIKKVAEDLSDILL